MALNFETDLHSPFVGATYPRPGPLKTTASVPPSNIFPGGRHRCQAPYPLDPAVTGRQAAGSGNICGTY